MNVDDRQMTEREREEKWMDGWIDEFSKAVISKVNV